MKLNNTSKCFMSSLEGFMPRKLLFSCDVSENQQVGKNGEKKKHVFQLIMRYLSIYMPKLVNSIPLKIITDCKKRYVHELLAQDN